MTASCSQVLVAGALAAAALWWPGVAGAASFPCEAARSAVEKLVCSRADTSDLDEHLGRYFAGAKLALKHADACLVNDQRQWLRNTRDACRDADCLKRVYLDRLATLDAVQPGMSRLKTMALPEVAALVWVVPPAADEVAAPRGRPSSPLLARGRIVDEVASGDGLVLHAADGARHVIVPLMFLSPPTTDALAGFAREPGARFELRGRVDDAQRGGRDFSTGHCTFVHRLPR